MTLDVYRGRKTTTQQQQHNLFKFVYCPNLFIVFEISNQERERVSKFKFSYEK